VALETSTLSSPQQDLTPTGTPPHLNQSPVKAIQRPKLQLTQITIAPPLQEPVPLKKIATINDSNMSIVNGLYPKPVPPLLHGPTHPQPIQDLHLPGNICKTTKQSGKNKGTGLLADSIDTFISLVEKNNPSINNNLQRLFTIVF
jgi:hypothetical protein